VENAQNLCKIFALFCEKGAKFVQNFALFCAQAQNFARFARFLRDFKLLCAVLFCANSQKDAHPWAQGFKIHDFHNIFHLKTPPPHADGKY
jgi:hypothetical protein